MRELQTLSEKMARAKHQIFVMDACYGGLLGTRGGGVDPQRPDYLGEILRRRARQVLTAGGANQEVVDGGPGGHGVFTGSLLEGIEKGLADLNGDGFMPFSGLVTYLVPKASNRYQTPAYSNLPGHELGEFVFEVTVSARVRDAAAEAGTPVAAEARRLPAAAGGAGMSCHRGPLPVPA